MVKQRLTCQQRNTWIIICCLLTVIAYCFGVPAVTTTSINLQANSSQSQSLTPARPSQPILPKGYGVHQSGRDLFAIPREFREDSATSPVVTPAKNNTVNIPNPVAKVEKKAEIPLMLIGIISGGGQAVAIIKKDTSSRSYRINDYVENYQLITIKDNSATLLGPQGQKVLTLER